MDYIELYNKMEPDKYYAAAELGVAGATMTAMVKRGLVIKKLGKPNTYCKAKANKLKTIVDAVAQYKVEFFTLTTAGKNMLCSLDGARVLNCRREVYDLAGADKMTIYQNGQATEIIL